MVIGLQVLVRYLALESPHLTLPLTVDVSGKLRVWSWDNPEHLMKLELPVFSGAIKDLDWDHESKKIVAVGDGSPLVGSFLLSISFSCPLA
jgi:hypothetical protein